MTVVTGELSRTVEARYDGSGYGRFKGDVAEAIVECSTRSRRATAECAATRPSSQRLLAMGAEKARASSAPTLALMYERMGFTRP